MDGVDVLGAALELFRARHYPGVVAACADALQDRPEDDASAGPIHLLAARSLLALRRDAEAQAHIRACLRLDPRCAAAYRLLGELAARADQLSSARIFLREAVRLAPDDLEAQEWLAVVDTMARPAASPARQPMPAPVPASARPAPTPRPASAALPLPPPSQITPLPRARGTSPPPRTSTGAALEPVDAPRPATGDFGQYLVECGLLTAVQLRAAMVYKRSTGVRLGAAAVALGLVSEARIEQASLAYHGRPRAAV